MLLLRLSKSRCEMLIGEMTLVMTSLPVARVFQCLFTFALVSASRWLAENRSSVYGGSQGNWRWNSNSIDVILSSPSFSLPAARAPRRACSQASFWINLIFCRFCYYSRDILGLGRATYFEAVFSQIWLARTSEFHVVWVLFGSLRNDDDGDESLKKWIHAVSILIAPIPCRSM